MYLENLKKMTVTSIRSPSNNNAINNLKSRAQHKTTNVWCSLKKCIIKKLVASLKPDYINVEKTSDLKREHGVDLKITIVSRKFEDLSIYKMHRLVNDALKEELKTNVLFLSIVAQTPLQWSQTKSGKPQPSVKSAPPDVVKLGGDSHSPQGIPSSNSPIPTAAKDVIDVVVESTPCTPLKVLDMEHTDFPIMKITDDKDSDPYDFNNDHMNQTHVIEYDSRGPDVKESTSDALAKLLLLKDSASYKVQTAGLTSVKPLKLEQQAGNLFTASTCITGIKDSEQISSVVVEKEQLGYMSPFMPFTSAYKNNLKKAISTTKLSFISKLKKSLWNKTLEKPSTASTSAELSINVSRPETICTISKNTSSKAKYCPSSKKRHSPSASVNFSKTSKYEPSPAMESTPFLHTFCSKSHKSKSSPAYGPTDNCPPSVLLSSNFCDHSSSTERRSLAPASPDNSSSFTPIVHDLLLKSCEQDLATGTSPSPVFDPPNNPPFMHNFSSNCSDHEPTTEESLQDSGSTNCQHGSSMEQSPPPARDPTKNLSVTPIMHAFLSNSSESTGKGPQVSGCANCEHGPLMERIPQGLPSSNLAMKSVLETDACHKNATSREDCLKQKLILYLEPKYIEVSHCTTKNSFNDYKTHLKIFIVSNIFEKLTKRERHRLVYIAALRDERETRAQPWEIIALTPKETKRKKSRGKYSAVM